MPTPPCWSLPDNPDLDHLRRQAKQLRDGAAAARPESLELVAAYDPPGGGPVPLARAQRVLARAYGFAGWSRLRAHLDTIAAFARPMEARDDGDGPVDRFLRLACLSYTEPDRSAEAGRAADLEAGASAHVLAARGRADALAALLAADPAAVSAEGGPHRWAPLLYLCYARIPQDDAPRTMRVLLDAGADPDAGFLWKGLTSPFTALTGVLGGGERGEPPHPDAAVLARMLLDAGADPNDNQALYNRAFKPDNSHLPPLLAHGLGTDLPSPWRDRLGTAYPSPAAMLGEHLRFAASSGFTERVRLLLGHGVDPDARGYHPIHRDRTAYEIAVRNGHRAAARLLADAGGTGDRLDDVDRLIGAALAGDRDAVAAAPPDLRAAAVRRRPDAIREAVERHGPPALDLLADIGFDARAVGRGGRTALHEAALFGDEPVGRWLLAHGADRTRRDDEHDGTPADWARFFGHDDLAALFAPDA